MDLKRLSSLKKIAGIGFILLILIDLWVHYQASHRVPIIPAPIVTIKKPTPLKITEYITQTGNTVAYNSVNLVARVEGYLEKILFTDGTFVKKNQPLFIIEPEPYKEQLLATQATVAAQKAATAYTKSEYARQQRMYKENATSLNNVEKWLAKSHETEAEVAKAEANEAIAAINYSYTHVNAPFDGRIGRHQVDLGNLVGNGVATNLATIEQIDPMYVYFNLNELDVIKLRDAAKTNGYDASKIKQIPVELSIQNGTGYTFKGKLDFINTGLNASTGTMEFRALMPNKDHQLLPGLFVQVRVALSKPTEQLTVPDTAVLYDQIGAYLLTVNANHIVELKRVSLGGVDQGQRAIIKGLSAQDNVIINGLQNATPGNPVSPQMETPNV